MGPILPHDHAHPGLPGGQVEQVGGGALPVRWGAKNDLSCGIYIYAFPVQQFLAIGFGDRLPFVGACVLALALTIPWAAASWFLVEKPAMKWKRLVPVRTRGIMPTPV